MSVLDGRRIAIIGGAGFIGHNMAIAMKAAGAHVEVIDGLEVNHLVYFAAQPPDNPNRALYLAILLERLDRLHAAGVPLRQQDAREYHGLSLHLSEIAPDTIIHLAAVAHANRSNKDPFSTFDHSMRTLENALDWARGAAHPALRLLLLEHGLRQLPHAQRHRGPSAGADRHLRRAEGRR